MSTTGNESQQPEAGAGEHVEPTTPDPDAAVSEVVAVDPDHHGQDGGRDTLTVGETQRAAGDEATQSRPAMSQNNASDDEKIAGIVAQTRVDVAHMGHERVVQVLRQRFDQTGIDVPDDRIDDLAREVLEG